MRRARNPRHEAPGFTLLEVLVALAIAMAALPVLYGGIATALRAAPATAAIGQAVSRATSRLAAIGGRDVAPGERSGDDGGGYRWKTNIRLTTTAPPPPGAHGGEWVRGTGLYAVSITIFWREGRAEKQFVLNGAVLGPVPNDQP